MYVTGNGKRGADFGSCDARTAASTLFDDKV
jgi:hypothetical protein